MEWEQGASDELSKAEEMLKNIEIGVEAILKNLGEDTRREGLVGTPLRVARMYSDMMYPEPSVFTTFDAEGMSEMIIQTDIPMYSFCEHHMLPFFGTVTVGYIPKGRIAGLSKLARAVKYCASGFQNQERITKAVATELEENLAPEGVGVVIKARHLCMEMRGAQMPGVMTTTSELRGAMMDKPEVRAEFLSLARQ